MEVLIASVKVRFSLPSIIPTKSYADVTKSCNRTLNWRVRWERRRSLLTVGSGEAAWSVGGGFVERRWYVMMGWRWGDVEGIGSWKAMLGDKGTVGSYSWDSSISDFHVVGGLIGACVGKRGFPGWIGASLRSLVKLMLKSSANSEELSTWFDWEFECAGARGVTLASTIWTSPEMITWRLVGL